MLSDDDAVSEREQPAVKDPKVFVDDNVADDVCDDVKERDRVIESVGIIRGVIVVMVVE